MGKNVNCKYNKHGWYCDNDKRQKPWLSARVCPVYTDAGYNCKERILIKRPAPPPCPPGPVRV